MTENELTRASSIITSDGVVFINDGVVAGNMDNFKLSMLVGYQITNADPASLYLQNGAAHFYAQGVNLTYDLNDQITGGTVTQLGFNSGPIPIGSPGPNLMRFTFEGVSAAKFGQWVATNATQEAFATVLAGADYIRGIGNDLIRGYGGDDRIEGGGGTDSLFGGEGNDQIYELSRTGPLGGGQSGPSFLRGEDGNDTIVGGSAFDDMHGNQGNDVLYGGDAGDWVVGGKDQDALYGEAGNDIVYGNMGDDTCDGGAGADTVRGGQGDDIVVGGDGNDWLSGDRGVDVLTGGSGADTFYAFFGARLDRVSDFSRQQGDRIQLDAGTSYVVTQIGSDVLVDLGGGEGLRLVGVDKASLTGDWIVFA